MILSGDTMSFNFKDYNFKNNLSILIILIYLPISFTVGKKKNYIFLIKSLIVHNNILIIHIISYK